MRENLYAVPSMEEKRPVRRLTVHDYQEKCIRNSGGDIPARLL